MLSAVTKKIPQALCSVFIIGSLLSNSQQLVAEGAEGKPHDLKDGDPTRPSESCTLENIQPFAPKDTTVAFVTRENGGLCRIHGHVTTQNPGPNRVQFMLVLPNNFNGRYVFIGMGGGAGQLPNAKASLLKQGYALAGTDSGTGAKTIADFSFKSNPAKLIDFQWRGVRRSAMATQQITKAYYGNDKLTRLISGCSGGGQMGMSNAIRFGDENFDGFITAATVWPGAAFKPNVYRIMQHMQTNPEGWLPPDLLHSAYTAIIERYDETDGARDGIIHDARNIEQFDLDILRKVGFTPAQITTFKRITSPAKFSAPGIYGDGLQAGWPVNDLAGWIRYITGTIAPPWPSTEEYSTSALQEMGVPFYHVMADTNIRAQRPGLDYWTITDDAELIDIATLGGTEVSTDSLDLSKVANSKAKMIIWHGTADEANSYLDNLMGYKAVVEKFPSARDWLQLYFVPGMQHCRGGNGPTEINDPMINALAHWVETGKAPEFVLAPRASLEKGIDRVFKLCPEPKRAMLKKSGLNPDKAESWECRLPE